MIVRDEIDLLDQCIDSAAGVVDEIIVGDTGSTDGSLELARRRAHRTLEIAWTDDFSAARNTTLEAATGEWILVLDADERLRVNDEAALARALRAPDVLAYRVRICNHLGDRKTGDVHLLRLFRRLPALRFSGRIHEQVAPAVSGMLGLQSGGAGGSRQSNASWRTATLPGVVIDHVGYDPRVRDQRAKSARNARLLGTELAEHPDDPYLHYKLSQALEHPDEAAHHLLRGASLLLTCPPRKLRAQAYAQELLTAAALQWLESQQPQRAAEASRLALAHFPDHPAPRIALGLALLRLGDIAGAREELEQALETRPPVDGFHFDAPTATVAALTGLARVHRESGSADRALELLAGLRRQHPDNDDVLLEVLECLLAASRPIDMLREGLLRLRQGSSPWLLVLCARAAEMLGDLEQARQWRNAALGCGAHCSGSER